MKTVAYIFLSAQSLMPACSASGSSLNSIAALVQKGVYWPPARPAGRLAKLVLASSLSFPLCYAQLYPLP